MDNNKITEESKEVSIILDKGIIRNAHNGNSGQLEDLVNARSNNNVIEPVQRGEYHSVLPSNFTNIMIHKRGAYEHYIGYNTLTKEVIHYNKDTGTTIQVIVKLQSIVDIAGIEFGVDETIIDIKPFLNYIIIATSDRLLRFLYTNTEYINISIELPIQLEIKRYDIESLHTEQSDNLDFDSLLANIYQLINDQSTNGRLAGAISWRAAYRLTDGTYLMLTTPRIIKGDLEWILEDLTENDGGRSVKMEFCRYRAELTHTYYNDLEEEKELISSIVIFFSKPIFKYDIDNTIKVSADDHDILHAVGYTKPANFSEYGTNTWTKEGVISDDYKSFEDLTTGWYKAGEIPIKDILDKDMSDFYAGKPDGEEEYDDDDKYDYIKIDSWYQNYATNEAFEIDQLSHHKIQASSLFIYNSRLWLARMKRSLASPEQILRKLEDDEGYSYPLKVIVRLKCNNETKEVIESYSGYHSHHVNSDEDIKFYFPVLYYFDSRAYEVSIYIKHEGLWKEFTTITMDVSEYYNLSYYFNKTNIINGSDEFQFSISKKINSLTLVDDSIFDVDNQDSDYYNQIQLSELNNPLVFPSEHNYPAGTGAVNSFGVANQPLSEGQYGQFPVYLFTTVGIYAAEIGTEDTIITATPFISTDVIEGSPVSTNYGVFYATANGIMIITGRNPKKLSDSLEGHISQVVGNDIGGRFALYSDHVSSVQLSTILTSIDRFELNMTSLTLGFDNINKRLMVSKGTWDYSYCYDVKNQKWYRVSEAYDYFVQHQPILLGINQTRGLINLSNIKGIVDPIQVHFHTQEIDFSISQKKKLDLTALRCQIKTSTLKRGVFMIFASNDKIKWTRITGNDRKTGSINDLLITYLPASYKYFIFSFWGELDYSFFNFFKSIDIQIEPRYLHKL